MHNLRVLVGFINGAVETADDVAAVGIANRLYMYILGHGVLSKMLVECRNGSSRAICRVIRGDYKTSWRQSRGKAAQCGLP